MTLGSIVYMKFPMKQLLVEIDEQTFERLEKISPGRSRRRSAFVRAALLRAIEEHLERATEEAYRRIPDTSDDAWFDAATWEPRRPTKRSKT